MAIPHLQIPLRVSLAGSLATVEQDSANDVEQCVLAILRTPQGYREDRPGMGLAGQAFRRGGPDLVEIERQLATYETRERMETLLAINPTGLAAGLAEIGVRSSRTG